MNSVHNMNQFEVTQDTSPMRHEQKLPYLIRVSNLQVLDKK